MSEVAGTIVASRRQSEDEMTPKLDVLTADDIHNELERLIASTRMSLEELEAKAANYALTPHEQGTLDKIRDLDYLGDAA